MADIGTEIQPNGCRFRIFANRCKTVDIHFENGEIVPLKKEKGGYFSKTLKNVKSGARYKFRIDGKKSFPDPLSKWQPEGPHGYSEVVSENFKWGDKKWKGIDDPSQVILYEMHIGTFTNEGTWKSAIKKLKTLKEMGITVIEMMPVAEFPGKFNWGYDGVNFFAPTHIYGARNDLKRFINEAHKLGLGVILDVVYNHFGPAGNYLEAFTDTFFTTQQTEWGKGINYKNPAVRSFFIANALYWIDEFHFDGFRFDAAHAFQDESPKHILQEITEVLRKKIKQKRLYITAENESQEIDLIDKYGLDAVWNEDFHHTSFVRLIGKSEAYLSDYRGMAQEFVSGAKYGFLYQGQWYDWQKKRRGSPSKDAKCYSLINFLENHDQIANVTPQSSRLISLSQPQLYRAMTAFFLLSPQTPLLFQGQEFGAKTPFHFFCDHEKALSKNVLEGRKSFLGQFESFKKAKENIADPNDEKTFLLSKLNWQKKDLHVFALFKDLIKIRKKDPIFQKMSALKIEGAVINKDAFLIRYTGENEERLLLTNMGGNFLWDPAPEPLQAPPKGVFWELLWVSEKSEYGGLGFRTIPWMGNWHITGPATYLLGAKKP